MVIASILVMGIVQMMKSTVGSAKKTSHSVNMEDALGRFTAVMLNDLGRAGSDPTGAALQAYIYEATCSGKLIFNYGIDPEPADPGCVNPLGEIGILSYLAYDSNGDGSIDPEEGLDLVSGVPTLRAISEDYIIYSFDSANHLVWRKNVGNPDDTADDSQEIVLTNVVDFDTRYFGYDEDGAYGEVTDNSRYDDIREVEVNVTVHSGTPEAGYINPTLPSGSPFETYRTTSTTFRSALLVRKEQ